MNEQGLVYVYVLTTITKDNNYFVQCGSAPNFQGGWVTLCTCKHYMRSWRSRVSWKDIWIAGFTGINITASRLNYLFYLMKVGYSFQSHVQMWNYLDVSVRKVKNARYNPCGDVYEPKSCLENEFNPSEYYPPLQDHVHAKGNVWHKDINYFNSRSNRRPSLLVGNQESSYLWSYAKLYFRHTIPRTKIWSLQDFIKLLECK